MDDVTRDLYRFLSKFFDLYPQLRENDFFIAGESYGETFRRISTNALLGLRKRDCCTEVGSLLDFNLVHAHMQLANTSRQQLRGSYR